MVTENPQAFGKDAFLFFGVCGVGGGGEHYGMYYYFYF